jgi:hypothetical protein
MKWKDKARMIQYQRDNIALGLWRSFVEEKLARSSGTVSRICL